MIVGGCTDARTTLIKDPVYLEDFAAELYVTTIPIIIVSSTFSRLSSSGEVEKAGTIRIIEEVD